MHARFFSRVLSKIRKRIIFIPVGGLASLTPYLLKDLSLFCYTRNSKENQTTSCEIDRCFATSWKLKRNPTILQEFVPLTWNYTPKKIPCTRILFCLVRRGANFAILVEMTKFKFSKKNKESKLI